MLVLFHFKESVFEFYKKISLVVIILSSLWLSLPNVQLSFTVSSQTLHRRSMNFLFVSFKHLIKDLICHHFYIIDIR